MDHVLGKHPGGGIRVARAAIQSGRFDATELVRIACEAGQKYIVITSKHHGGFAIFDSKVFDYYVVDATPYGKDILAALAEEAKRQGIKLAFYYPIMDWHHPAQYVDPDAETPHAGHAMDKMHAERKQEYVTYVKAQLAELVEQYDPTILWFDGEWPDWWTEEDGKDLYNYVRLMKHDIIINNLVGKGRMGMEGLNRRPGYAGDFGTPVQQIYMTTASPFAQPPLAATPSASPDAVRARLRLAGGWKSVHPGRACGGNVNGAFDVFRPSGA